MFALSVAVEINPPGASPLLTREEVWRGLTMKAENALPFVPAMQSCSVLERFENGLVREVVARGERFTERVTFTPPIQVLFERQDERGNAAGWITNVISESDRGLLLTFTFEVAIAGVLSGSVQEQQRGDEMKGSYVDAVRATLAAVRKLKLERGSS
ncbi:MAG TPA: SRPBCC family protein [Candidatus Acidoferrales bacterium]|nr:SRPBCC family protein [Candidatus Acidoferrales bacterium]